MQNRETLSVRVGFVFLLFEIYFVDVGGIGSLHQDCGRPPDLQGLLVGDRPVASGLNCKSMTPKR